MEKQLNVDKDLVKLDEWKAILSNKEFNSTVREHIEKRIKDLQKNSEVINSQKKTLDGSIELGHQFSKIEELRMLLSHFDRKMEKIKQREVSVAQ